MAMSRLDAVDYLHNQYEAIATLAGQGAGDTPAGYGPAIDDALLSMDTAYADLAGAAVADTSIREYRALLRYHALRHFEQKLAVKVDFDVVGASASVSKKQSAQLAQIRAMLMEARGEVASLGYVVGGAATIQSVRYNPDVPYRVDELIP